MPNCLNTYYKCIFHHKKLVKMTCYSSGKSILALMLKSFPPIFEIWRFILNFVNCDRKKINKNSSKHQRIRNQAKIVSDDAFSEDVIKLETNFQHWLATNKTLGNDYTCNLHYSYFTGRGELQWASLCVLKIVWH